MKTLKRLVFRATMLASAFFLSLAFVPKSYAQFLTQDIPHTIITSAIKYLQGASFGDLVEGVKKLEQISKTVRQAQRGIQLAKLSGTLIGKINTVSTTLASDKHILDFEYQSVSKRFGTMSDEISLAVKDLSNIVQTNGTTMDDAGRLELINKAYDKVAKVDNELGGIMSYFQMVSRKRGQNEADRASTARLYSAASRTITNINTKANNDFSRILENAYADDKFQNVDLEKEKNIRLAIAEDVSKETARINNYVNGQEKLARSQFAVGAALTFPKRSDAPCKALQATADMLIDKLGEGVEADPRYQALIARIESCNTEVDVHNDQVQAKREQFIDEQMISSNSAQKFSDMRRDMQYDAMVAIFKKYGKVYTVPRV